MTYKSLKNYIILFAPFFKYFNLLDFFFNKEKIYFIAFYLTFLLILIALSLGIYLMFYDDIQKNYIIFLIRLYFSIGYLITNALFIPILSKNRKN